MHDMYEKVRRGWPEWIRKQETELRCTECGEKITRHMIEFGNIRVCGSDCLEKAIPPKNDLEKNTA